MTEFTPNRKVKYFFGYYNLFGQAAPMMWVEEDGLIVGGVPTPPLQKHEITEDEFHDSQVLTKMSKKYPVELDVRRMLSNSTEVDLT